MIAIRIIKIIQNTFSDNTNTISLETTPNDIDEWDSLGQIILVQAIEESFAISFELDELLNFDSVKSIINIVTSKTEK